MEDTILAEWSAFPAAGFDVTEVCTTGVHGALSERSRWSETDHLWLCHVVFCCSSKGTPHSSFDRCPDGSPFPDAQVGDAFDVLAVMNLEGLAPIVLRYNSTVYAGIIRPTAVRPRISEQIRKHVSRLTSGREAVDHPTVRRSRSAKPEEAALYESGGADDACDEEEEKKRREDEGSSSLHLQDAHLPDAHSDDSGSDSEGCGDDPKRGRCKESDKRRRFEGFQMQAATLADERMQFSDLRPLHVVCDRCQQGLLQVYRCQECSPRAMYLCESCDILVHGRETESQIPSCVRPFLLLDHCRHVWVAAISVSSESEQQSQSSSSLPIPISLPPVRAPLAGGQWMYRPAERRLIVARRGCPCPSAPLMSKVKEVFLVTDGGCIPCSVWNVTCSKDAGGCGHVHDVNWSEEGYQSGVPGPRGKTYVQIEIVRRWSADFWADPRYSPANKVRAFTEVLKQKGVPESFLPGSSLRDELVRNAIQLYSAVELKRREAGGADGLQEPWQRSNPCPACTHVVTAGVHCSVLDEKLVQPGDRSAPPLGAPEPDGEPSLSPPLQASQVGSLLERADAASDSVTEGFEAARMSSVNEADSEMGSTNEGSPGMPVFPGGVDSSSAGDTRGRVRSYLDAVRFLFVFMLYTGFRFVCDGNFKYKLRSRGATNVLSLFSDYLYVNLADRLSRRRVERSERSVPGVLKGCEHSHVAGSEGVPAAAHGAMALAGVFLCMCKHGFAFYAEDIVKGEKVSTCVCRNMIHFLKEAVYSCFMCTVHFCGYFLIWKPWRRTVVKLLTEFMFGKYLLWMCAEFLLYVFNVADVGTTFRASCFGTCGSEMRLCFCLLVQVLTIFTR
jgi:hypothetical protein